VGLFSTSLGRLRIESGFATPYAFYHRNGGRRVFPFTYAYYLKLEHGKHLPRPQWLPLLLNLLRIRPSDEMYRRFVVDYLRDHFGSEENFQSLLGPLLRSKHEKNYEQQAVKRLISRQAYHLTPEQYKAVVADAATYWAFECLVNDHASFGPEELAEITGLPEASIEAGLKKLASQKLARPVSGGRYKSPLAGKFYVFPRSFPGVDIERAKVARHVDEMVLRRGTVLQESGMMIRAEEGAVRRAISTLNNALETAQAFAVHEKAEGSGFFRLEIRARKAADF
jgi:hypothetical protein